MVAKFVIAGGSGLVGSALTRALEAQGHQVLLLVRKPRPELPQVAWAEREGALEGAAALINLAGEPIADQRWNPERRRSLLESRTGTTRSLVEAMQRAGSPKVLVNASAIGYYGCRDSGPVDEECPPGRGFLPDLCQAWEAEANAAQGARVVKLRLGVVLAREGGALPRLARAVRWGLGAKLGSGSQGMSWIHIEDLVRLIIEAALDPSFEGAYNAVSPSPVSNAVFMRTLGRLLHRPILPLPGWLTASALRLALGPLAEEMLLGGAFVLPARLQARGFEFRHPDLEEALRSLYSWCVPESSNAT